MNWRGTQVLFQKETHRFLKVVVQTVLSPVITALLYLLVFAQVLEGREVTGHTEIPYTAFLIPGLMMMSLVQNAFANASSSLIQSKMMGGLTFLLMAPIGALEMFLGYVMAAVFRGILVAFSIYIAALFLVDVPITYPNWILVFSLISAGVMGAAGLMAGIWADKIDQLALLQNFIVLPLSFLSGVFYSIHALPEIWQIFSYLNPFLYMIDGFRYGFIGVSDIPIGISLSVSLLFLFFLCAVSLIWLKRGYKLRH